MGEKGGSSLFSNLSIEMHTGFHEHFMLKTEAFKAAAQVFFLAFLSALFSLRVLVGFFFSSLRAPVPLLIFFPPFYRCVDRKSCFPFEPILNQK